MTDDERELLLAVAELGRRVIYMTSALDRLPLIGLEAYDELVSRVRQAPRAIIDATEKAEC